MPLEDSSELGQLLNFLSPESAQAQQHPRQCKSENSRSYNEKVRDEETIMGQIHSKLHSFPPFSCHFNSEEGLWLASWLWIHLRFLSLLSHQAEHESFAKSEQFCSNSVDATMWMKDIWKGLVQLGENPNDSVLQRLYLYKAEMKGVLS